MLSLLLLSRDGLAGMVAARDDFPKPTEEEAQQLFAPNKVRTSSHTLRRCHTHVHSWPLPGRTVEPTSSLPRPCSGAQ